MTDATMAASVTPAMDDQPEPTSEDTRPQSQHEMAGMDLGMRVLSYLIAGVLVYGALGWLGDHYLGTRFLLPTGIVLGAAGGCYVIIRRYGQVPVASGLTSRRRSYRTRQGATDKTEEIR